MVWSVLCSMVCVVVVAVPVVSGVTGQQTVQVNTPHGALKGVRTTVGPHSYVDTYYSIPYAQPPVGPLRFHGPVPNHAWTGTRDATVPGPMCPQRPLYHTSANDTSVGTEDCLYLNVYTPKVSSANSGPLPVMVWIHGGGYYLGGANFFNGTQLASKGVVLVTINYRLGALGFLSTEDGASIGNYGLLDQLRALRWVRDTISSFNGDPNDVTIFGESAGSSCVSLLVITRAARGLFTKAIQESGSSLGPWAIRLLGTEPEPKTQAHTLASRLGCHVTDSIRLVACLRTKDPRVIVETQSKMELENDNRLTFAPIPEVNFGKVGLFTATPDVILRDGWFNNVTVIRGFNKDELALGQQVLDPDDDGFTMNEVKNLTRAFVHNAVLRQYKLNEDKAFDLVMETYVTRPGLVGPKQLRAAYFQMVTDFDFIASIYEEQKLYFNAHGKTEYLYRFSFRSANRLNKDWQGTVHADELSYVFGYPLADTQIVHSFVSSWTSDDKRIAQEMMTLWSNFAKYGNPTPNGVSSFQWLPWTTATPRYLDINVQSVMTSAPDTPGVKLWNDVIPKLARAGQNGIIG
ncbi:neuroligin-4, X-linked-like [Littorina saxatilis]|uniref:Carboxylesterase type B domain-containing protein n=1 Tax=Littorina saxatilis TaxID=31220 RepID=A0AAN9G835_9CAEN